MSNRGSILITGGAGYIGSHCSRAVAEAGKHDGTVADALVTRHGQFGRNVAKFAGAELRHEEIEDVRKLSRAKGRRREDVWPRAGVEAILCRRDFRRL